MDFDQHLRRLAKLKDEGIITEQDFEIKKKEILAEESPASLSPKHCSPAAPEKASGHKHVIIKCIGVVFAFVVLTGILGSLSDDGNGSAQQASASSRITKAAWKAKFGDKFGFAAKLGIVEMLKPDQFKAVMGSPDRTQTVGDDAFWYYECSDGMIQIELYALNLAVGMMQGRINDY